MSSSNNNHRHHPEVANGLAEAAAAAAENNEVVTEQQQPNHKTEDERHAQEILELVAGTSDFVTPLVQQQQQQQRQQQEQQQQQQMGDNETAASTTMTPTSTADEVDFGIPCVDNNSTSAAAAVATATTALPSSSLSSTIPQALAELISPAVTGNDERVIVERIMEPLQQILDRLILLQQQQFEAFSVQQQQQSQQHSQEQQQQQQQEEQPNVSSTTSRQPVQSGPPPANLCMDPPGTETASQCKTPPLPDPPAMKAILQDAMHKLRPNDDDEEWMLESVKPAFIRHSSAAAAHGSTLYNTDDDNDRKPLAKQPGAVRASARVAAAPAAAAVTWDSMSSSSGSTTSPDMEKEPKVISAQVIDEQAELDQKTKIEKLEAQVASIERKQQEMLRKNRQSSKPVKAEVLHVERSDNKVESNNDDDDDDGFWFSGFQVLLIAGFVFGTGIALGWRLGGRRK